MLRVGVVGASGRTGRHVVSALRNSQKSKLHIAIVSPTSSVLGTECADGILYTSKIETLAGCDAVVDFSIAATTVQVAKLCAAHGKPLLVGTTGLSPVEREEVEKAGATIPLCIAPNTSLSATALAMASKYLQQLLGSAFDIEVMEIHHRMKRDAPSGTALNVIANLEHDVNSVVFGREGLRRAGEIGVTSLRGGDVPGEHTVYFLGDGERIELTQRAQNREVFGTGAVVLLERLASRGVGVFSVRDLMEHVG